MRLRPFGRTGLAVSPIGLGTVKFGRTRGLKYPERFAVPDDAAARRLLDLAAELGVNLLDTAPAYGASEARLGTLLAGRRERWVISTKAGEEFDEGSGTSRFDFSPEHIRFSVERSLRLLRTDRLDIVLAHSDGRDRELVERWGVLDTLARLKAEGKLVAFGLSGKTAEGGLLALSRSDCAMATYSLAERGETPVLDAAAAAGKAVLVKKAFGSGHLVAGGAAPAAEALGFALAHPGVAAVVVGTIDPGHLKANVEAAQAALTTPETAQSR